MPKLKLFSQWPLDWNASIYYRLLQPIQAMVELNLIEPILDRGDRRVPLEQVRDASAFSDVFLQYQRMDGAPKILMEHNRKRPSYWRSKEEWAVAPIFVMDTDDDILNVLPLNPAFKELGTHIGGKKIPKGGVVGVEMDDGGKMILFKDGEHDFDIERNEVRANNYRESLSVVDLVTCSTPRVEQYVKREAPDANTFVVPNCIDFRDYPRCELADHPDEIRILWQGGTSHHEDLWPLRESIVRLSKKYPQTKWIFWGAPYKWLCKNMDVSQISLEDWVPYYEYKLRLSMMNHDIAIAPLHQSTFNNSRSAIKVYESAAVWKPAPTVAQRTGAYQDEIIEGQTGLLFDTPEQFETQMAKLIEDAKLRKMIASNMKDWLRTNRDPMVWGQKLFDVYAGLVDKRRALLGPPKEIVEAVPDEPIPAS